MTFSDPWVYLIRLCQTSVRKIFAKIAMFVKNLHHSIIGVLQVPNTPLRSS